MIIGGVCKLCGDECESIVHVLWECPTEILSWEKYMIGRGGEEFEEF